MNEQPFRVSVAIRVGTVNLAQKRETKACHLGSPPLVYHA